VSLVIDAEGKGAKEIETGSSFLIILLMFMLRSELDLILLMEAKESLVASNLRSLVATDFRIGLEECLLGQGV
jgi:hypothetical protein